MKSPWFGDFFVDLQDLGEIGHVQGQIRSHLGHEDLHLTGGGTHGPMGKPWENPWKMVILRKIHHFETGKTQLFRLGHGFNSKLFNYQRVAGWFFGRIPIENWWFRGPILGNLQMCWT